MARDKHWDRVYSGRESNDLTWYQRHLSLSLRFIGQTGLPKTAAILDAGGGPSTLVDDLLDQGYGDLTVLDCSSAAIDSARARLGERAKRIQWLEKDIVTSRLPASRFDLWHDRAVFHFLTEEEDRAAYRASLERSLRSGGHLIMATFALTGPERCSGLPVVRYDAAGLQQELGPDFRLAATDEEVHRTPSGNLQNFLYCSFRKD